MIESELKQKEDIERIIYWFRRYKGTRVGNGKVYDFLDLDVLEKRIITYLEHPDKFNFDNPEMGWTY
jgi:hypothetical protein